MSVKNYEQLKSNFSRKYALDFGSLKAFSHINDPYYYNYFILDIKGVVLKNYKS